MPTPPATPRLVLWDIDKTLVDIGDISKEIYAAAFQAATGVALRHLPVMAGRTDRDLIVATLKLHDMPEPQKYLPAFYDALAAATAARQSAIQEHGRCLPGAREAITRLGKTAGVVQTVVTGNIRPIAKAKLSAFGLASAMDLTIGGYGSEDGERATLVRLACQRARQKYQLELPSSQVFVVGDTPYDMAGARANGVKAIGVTSGSSTADELRTAGADAVLPSLEDTAVLLRLILR